MVRFAFALTPILGLLLSGIPSPAGAFVLTGSKWLGPGVPIRLHINSLIDEECVAGVLERLEIQAAVDTWTSLAGTDVDIQIGRHTALCGLVADGYSTVSFDDCLEQCTGPCVGVSSVVDWGSGGDPGWAGATEVRGIAEVDVTFSAQWSFARTAPLLQSCEDDCAGADAFDLLGAATHEIGHILGLGHSSVQGATMRSWMSPCDASLGSLSEDDEAGLRMLYPEGRISMEERTLEGGQVRCSLLNAGNVGVSGSRGSKPGQYGAGFQYPIGVPNLHEGALVLGTGPGDPVSSDARRSALIGQDNDFVPVTGVLPLMQGESGAARAWAAFDDSAAEMPYGVQVEATMLAWPDPPFDTSIVLCYLVRNDSSSPLENLRVGLYLDWNLGGYPWTNTLAWNPITEMGIVTDPSVGHVVGFAVLNPEGTSTFRALRVGTPMTESTTAQHLHGGFSSTSVEDADVAVIIASGDFDVAPGGSARVSFVLTGGPDITELEARIGAVRALDAQGALCAQPAVVATGTGVVPPGPAPRLGPGMPNPSRALTSVGFELARGGMALVRVFDAAGRRVRTLVSAHLRSGPHTARWDGRDARGRLVAPGVYFVRLDANGETRARSLVRAR